MTMKQLALTIGKSMSANGQFAYGYDTCDSCAASHSVLSDFTGFATAAFIA